MIDEVAEKLWKGLGKTTKFLGGRSRPPHFHRYFIEDEKAVYVLSMFSIKNKYQKIAIKLYDKEGC